MRLHAEFHPAIKRELDSAYRWYEAQGVGLGKRFLNDLELLLQTIVTQPELFGILDGMIRAAPLSRFPYVVYYRISAPVIRILAVHHVARDPSSWQSRD